MNRSNIRQERVFTTTPIIPRIKVPDGAVFFPDDRGWTNRMEFQSQSGSFYTISQHAAKRHWACSCPGGRNHRKCKHLTALGLPNGERPFEAILVRADGSVISEPAAAPAPGPVGAVFNAAPVSASREVASADEA